jgi:hypothetical protein
MTPPAWGQSAQMAGTVSDSARAIIPGASIEIVNSATQVKWAKSPVVARPAHESDLYDFDDHGSILNQPEAVVCSWDLLSRQVPPLRHLVSRATPNHLVVHCSL